MANEISEKNPVKIDNDVHIKSENDMDKFRHSDSTSEMDKNAFVEMDSNEHFRSKLNQECSSESAPYNET